MVGARRRDRRGPHLRQCQPFAYARVAVGLAEAKHADPGFLSSANMIPICICDDVEGGEGVNRRTLSRYTMLPNYRNLLEGSRLSR